MTVDSDVTAAPSAEAQPVRGKHRVARRSWLPGAPLLLAMLLIGVVVGAGAVSIRDAAELSAQPPPAAQVLGPGPALAWAPPELDNSRLMHLDEDTTTLRLDPDRDFEVRLPEEPLVAPEGVTIIGGRNVVLTGGEIVVPADPDGAPPDVRAIYLVDQTGTIHVEGVQLSGEGLGEGFALNQRLGATVQIQNVRIGTVRGSEDGHHADVIQTWAGPAELRVDRLSGSTTYQGLFLLPKQFGDQPAPEQFDLRHIDIQGLEGSAYLMWRDERDWPMRVEDVWVSVEDDRDRELTLWPRDDLARWDGVTIGRPPEGEFVPEGVAGTGYLSPGYLSPEQGQGS